MLARFAPRLLFACLLTPAAAASWAAGAPAGTPAGQPRAVLALAEQPLRLIRGAALYKAPVGIAVQKDDILETLGTGAQVEAGPDAIVALGPQTRVLFASLAPGAGAATEVTLLQGWVKVLARGGKRGRVVTPVLQVTLPSGSTIVRTAQDGFTAAVFAEEGEQQAARFDAGGRAGAPLRLAAEQYAQPDPASPRLVAGRPPRAFVAGMPPAFRDRLVASPVAANAGKVAPVKEREVGFEDVEAWLKADLPAAQGFVARFRPRLADPAFRKPLERALGQSAPWKAALQPAQARAPSHQENPR
jgi:hypothetical protein